MKNDIESVIRNVVREQLSGVTVEEVRVTKDTDYDGDAIYRVMVIYDAKTGLPDIHKITGLARHIRSQFQNDESVGFPILRFVSQSDAKRLRSEAA